MQTWEGSLVWALLGATKVVVPSPSQLYSLFGLTSSRHNSDIFLHPSRGQVLLGLSKCYSGFAPNSHLNIFLRVIKNKSCYLFRSAVPSHLMSGCSRNPVISCHGRCPWRFIICSRYSDGGRYAERQLLAHWWPAERQPNGGRACVKRNTKTLYKLRPHDFCSLGGTLMETAQSLP